MRTSLDPVLQAAANKALRDGLIAYDHQLGRLARAGHAHRQSGAGTRLARAAGEGARGTPGMLPTWQLAIVLSTTDNEARVGWLSGLGVRGVTPQPNLGEIPMSDVDLGPPAAWRGARPGTEADHRCDAGRRRRDDRAGTARGGRHPAKHAG